MEGRIRKIEVNGKIFKEVRIFPPSSPFGFRGTGSRRFLTEIYFRWEKPIMRLGVPRTARLLNKRDRLVEEFVGWDDNGRQTAPTARLLAGQYAFRYRQRYGMAPISRVQSDLETFDAMLSILDGNPRLASYCIDVLFSLKDFTMNVSAFSNPNVLDKWNVIERAEKLFKREGMRGEQSEFKSDQKSYGVIRV